MKKLMTKLTPARADGTYLKLIAKLSKQNLLILDDFGHYPLEQQQALDLMEIIEDRHGKNATIMVSQLPVKDWYEVLQESVVAATSKGGVEMLNELPGTLSLTRLPFTG